MNFLITEDGIYVNKNTIRHIYVAQHTETPGRNTWAIHVDGTVYSSHTTEQQANTALETLIDYLEDEQQPE